MPAVDDARTHDGVTGFADRGVPVIRRIHLKNLKSLAGQHDVPIAPLTFIFGPNSAGKSSLLGSVKTVLEWWEALAIQGDNPGDDALRRNFRLIHDFHNTVSFGDSERGLSIGLTLGATGSRVEGGGIRIGLEDAGAADGIGLHVNLRIPEEEPLAVRRILAPMPAVEIDVASFGPHSEMSSAFLELAAKVAYLGPHRGDPANVGKQLAVWLFSEPSAGAALNDSLGRLDVPYSVRAGTFRDVDPEIGSYLEELDRSADWADDSIPFPDDIDTLLLTDARNGARVRLSEVGYGVSQLLPLAIACIDQDPHLLLIEQPELHLHPRLQSDVGELLVDAVRRGHQVIVETHSENILLRTQRLVRQGDLAADDVCVLYVDNTREDGVSVQRLELGADGDLLDPWPTGFFDDRLDDILGILE